MATFGQTTCPAPDSGLGINGYVYFSGGQIAEGGTLSSVSVYLATSSGNPNGYVGVWKSATDSPTSAALIGTTGLITSATTGQYNTWSLTGSLTFSANDWLWIGVLHTVEAVNEFSVKTETTDSGDFSTPTGLKLFNYTVGGLSALPDPLGAGQDGGYLTRPLAAYVTYTAGASVATRAATYYMGGD